MLATDAFGSRMSLVCLRLFLALEDAVQRLRNAGAAVGDLDEVLARYEEWRRTGRWPRLGLELKPAMDSTELRRRVSLAISLLEQVLPLLRGNETIGLLTECEGWVERAIHLLPEES